ncbi:hypothetical protein AEST_01670 [Alishewanella aestuarii B11]|uniref:DUF4238 domain-containing protein n=1 Tax=Alishewanella aestuarii B11 TaxID=1197174 RepID=J1QND1_9ALTE|nr:DUF4238 domain-containing protein [Alishewanella aestuarii]EJI87126.1 hypothetical protein AEST_01670 [Alishewanella aestuarii B11]
MTNKHLELKRNHHSVWAHYLKGWSPDGSNVFSTTRSKKIIFDSVKMLTVERDFYKVCVLTDEHLSCIRGVSKLSPIHLHNSHMQELDSYLQVQLAQLKSVDEGYCSEDSERVFLAWAHNSMENQHAQHELEVREIVRSLACRDLSVLEKDNNMLLFMQFIGQQVARTKVFKRSSIERLSLSEVASVREHARLFQECWWFMHYMFGMSIAYSLFFERGLFSNTLLINGASESFITSDQPVINIHPALDLGGENLSGKECDFYYPVSPKVAYIISRSGRYSSGVVEASEELVLELNEKMAKSALVNIISDNERALKSTENTSAECCRFGLINFSMSKYRMFFHRIVLTESVAGLRQQTFSRRILIVRRSLALL